MLYKILCNKSVVTLEVYYSWDTNRYNNQNIPLRWQFVFIPSRINNFGISDSKISPLALTSSVRMLLTLGNICLLPSSNNFILKQGQLCVHYFISPSNIKLSGRSK